MRKVIESNKNKIVLYFINALALMPLLCFGFKHFSIDTYLVALENGIDGHINAFIGAFRYVGALIHKIWYLLGQNPIANPLLDTLIFIFIVALSTTFLSNFIYKQLRQKSTLNYIIVNLSVLISVANVWFINILTFPESIFATAIGVLLCFSAIVVYFSNQNILSTIISAFLLICSTAIYQQFLVVFIIYSILLCSIKLHNDDSATKTIVFTYLKLIALILLSGIIYYGVGICVQKWFSVVPNERVALNIDSIINNLIYYITKQRSYLKGRGIFDTEILTLCYVTVGTVWIITLINYIRKNKVNFKSVCLFFSYIVAYASSFLMGVISTSRVFRTMFGLFTVFALFSIGSIMLQRKKIVKYVLSFALCIVFALNMYANIEMSFELREINTQETMLAEQFLYQIEEYEKTENKIVKNIEFCSDMNQKISGGSALRVAYSFGGLMEYVTGRNFNVSEMTNEEIRKDFEEKDWDVLVLDEQLIFENDTLYICVY